MQSSGESEFSTESSQPRRLTLNFWQSFLLTLAGAAGLISLIADGPFWLTVTGLGLTIVLLIWLIAANLKKSK